jgi:N-[(2S)-2-amino-2-carboxyethyl]-L-glutamate dehydrogenase
VSPRTQFRYLSEADCIAAGVLDVDRCVDVSEEVFRLLAAGDYLMGGPNHNSHGMGVVFPKESPFPNMPVAGPDRRFVAMPGYLGGRFDVCGNKWYGSNHANVEKDLPRSVLTLMLNDKDTGEPLALMSANLISSARTGAVPGVATRWLARPGSETAAVLGCGPINKACFEAIKSQMPTLKKVYCFDLFEAAAANFASWARELGVEAVVELDLRAALADAEIVSVAASRLKPMQANDAFWVDSTIVYDSIGLHEAYVEEALAAPDKAEAYAGVIGGPLYTLIDENKLPALRDSTELGSVVLRDRPGRTSDEDRVVFIACGMSVFDLAWGYELYEAAQARGIGIELDLWATPVSD